MIGGIFIYVFDAEASRVEGVKFLTQGTLYPVKQSMPSAPRVVTLSSLDKQSADMRVTFKREAKLSTVELAISRLRNAESKGTNEQDKKKLAEFFNSPLQTKIKCG